MTVNFVLEQLGREYGTLESKESATRKFFSCEQKSNETVQQFATRLEDLYDRALQLKAFVSRDRSILKEIFYSGLKPEIKHLTTYQRDRMSNYEEFKWEVRKIESEMSGKSAEDSKKGSKPAAAAVNVATKDDKESKEMTKVTQILEQLNNRIAALEKQKEDRSAEGATGYSPHWQAGNNQQWGSGYYGNGYGRGYRGNGRGNGRGGQGRGRGDKKPHRPLAAKTMAPLCFICNEKGHFQRNCPAILEQIGCFKCKQKGHLGKDCPKE